MQHPTGGKESEDATLQSARSVFHVHKVSKIYRMGEVEVHALRDVTLDLYESEFAVLLGASGTGLQPFAAECRLAQTELGAFAPLANHLPEALLDVRAYCNAFVNYELASGG